MGLTKGLKQIAAELISLLGKDKAHRGSRRDGRAASDMRTSRARSARCMADAPTSGAYLSTPPTHSTLPHIPSLEPNLAFSRDALSDDGARAVPQPTQHSVSSQNRNQLCSSNSIVHPHQTASYTAQAAQRTQPSGAFTSAPVSAGYLCSAPTPATLTSPIVGASAFSHANTVPLFNSVDPGPTSGASEDPGPPPLDLGRLASFTPAPPATPATTAAAARAPTSVDSACCAVVVPRVALRPSPLPAGAATASAAAATTPAPQSPLRQVPQPQPAMVAVAGGASEPQRPRAAGGDVVPPASPVAACQGAAPAPTACSARQPHGAAGLPPAVERSAASAASDNQRCCPSGGSQRPMPSIGQLYTSSSLPGTMRRAKASWSTDDFEIGKKIHKGYSSSVYRATCLYSGSDVVLKAYNLAGLSTFLRNQVLRELDIHSRLRHPGVVHLMAAFREEDNLVMVQEFIRGGSLARVRRKLGGRMTEFQAMHLVLLPLLGVLTYLHERGIVHRDIKPENLLFTDNWKLKVCDFGVSVCLREERAVTRTGTREYLAPEVDCCPPKRLPEDNKTNTSLAYTSAVDVWSLGSLMYELLVGFTPFPGGPPAKKDGVRGSAGAALAFPSSVSQGARAFIRDCLELEPADRPTVQQLLGHTWVQEALTAAEALIAK